MESLEAPMTNTSRFGNVLEAEYKKMSTHLENKNIKLMRNEIIVHDKTYFATNSILKLFVIIYDYL